MFNFIISFIASLESQPEYLITSVPALTGSSPEKAAKKFVEILKQKGAKKVAITDLARDDMAEAVEDAFKYDKVVVASSTYNMGIFPPMEHFLLHLKGKNYQNRKIGIIENGSWAPASGKLMKTMFEQMKDITICENIVTIKSAMKNENIVQMEKLADELLKI